MIYMRESRFICGNTPRDGIICNIYNLAAGICHKSQLSVLLLILLTQTSVNMTRMHVRLCAFDF